MFSKSHVPVLSWALYDLANTIFFFNILSVHFALWVVNDMGGSDADYGYANAAAMFFVLLSAPILGNISDQTRRRKPFLILTTVWCVFFTSLLGQGSLTSSLYLFVAANYMFQSGLIFYDAMLPTISTKQNRGRVGALGVGFGYIGSLIGAVIGILFLEEIGRVGIFKVTAALFLVFSIPCFIFVKDQTVEQFRIGLRTVIDSFAQVRRTFRRAHKLPGVSRFLIGRIFYTDAINTLIIFIGIYVTNELGLTTSAVQILVIISIIAAILGAPAWGFTVDLIGPKKTLNLVLYLWMIVLMGVSAIPFFDLPSSLIWIIAPLSGIAMGGVWCADRPYLVHLVPAQAIGEFFGIYNMVGRFASIMGPLLWVLVSDTLGFGRPAAILSLLILIFIAYGILQGVSDKPRELRTKA